MPKPSSKTKCQCLSSRYHVPRFNEIPPALLNLSAECISALRPFDLDCGTYKRQKHGYRVKTGMIQLHVSPKSVTRKIRDLVDVNDRWKCRIAYDYLINSNASSYSHFIELRQEILKDHAHINCFDFSATIGIECALCPNIYPFTAWCESAISGKETRLSSQKSFCTKVFSEITDYALQYDLLHAHDLHMLMWLKDITKAQHQYLHADIPHSHPELAFLVHKLQPSDKKSQCLKLQDQE